MKRNNGSEKGRIWKKEWAKEDKIVFVRKCKIWSNQYKETKRELEERKNLHKNKNRKDNKRDKTKHKKGKYKKSMAKIK